MLVINDPYFNVKNVTFASEIETVIFKADFYYGTIDYNGTVVFILECSTLQQKYSPNIVYTNPDCEFYINDNVGWRYWVAVLIMFLWCVCICACVLYFKGLRNSITIMSN